MGWIHLIRRHSSTLRGLHFPRQVCVQHFLSLFLQGYYLGVKYRVLNQSMLISCCVHLAGFYLQRKIDEDIRQEFCHPFRVVLVEYFAVSTILSIHKQKNDYRNVGKIVWASAVRRLRSKCECLYCL